MAPRFRFIVVLIACALCFAPAYARAQQTGRRRDRGLRHHAERDHSPGRRAGRGPQFRRIRKSSTVLSDGDGHFRFTALQEGKYTLTASLDGLRGRRARRSSSSLNDHDERSLDLPLATLTQTVEVMAPTAIVSAADTLGSSESINSHETDEFANGSGLGGALRLLASVIEVPGGVSIKGGRPTQAGVQIGASTLTDPVLGLVHFTLPDDAIDSVAVMPNPYAVEYGRFSSGLVVIQTRRGGDAWHVRLNNLSPTFRSKRHEDLYNINGIAGFGAQLRAGRPDRQEPRVPRADGAVPLQQRRCAEPSRGRAPHHALDQLVHARRRQPDAEALAGRQRRILSEHHHDGLARHLHAARRDRRRARARHARHGDRARAVERLAGVRVDRSGARLQASVQPQGTAPMQLRPETTLGNFFNTQYRSPTTFQLIQTASGSAKLPSGLHLFKVGLDLLVNNYDGTSESRPFLIERIEWDAGPTSRRLGARRSQMLPTTDVALYAQDRVQPNSRWYVEFGARLDRDGVVGRWNVTPRIGSGVAAERAGSVGAARRLRPVLRAHAVSGRRLQVRAVRDVHRYALRRRRRDAAGTAGHFSRRHVAEPADGEGGDVGRDLRVPLAAVVVDACELPRSAGQPRADARRRAVGQRSARCVSTPTASPTYRDLEAGVHLSHSSRFDLTATYSRSLAEGDLNSFANYFDTMLWPVVPPRGYGPLPTDVPNRFLARGRLLPAANWLIVGRRRLANRPAVLAGRRRARFRRARATSNGCRTTCSFDLGLEHRFQDRQAAAVDRHPRLQRVQRVPAGRRPGEYFIARLRIFL